MPIAVYGSYGFALLMIPTAAADYLEYERFQLMDHVAQFVDAGKVKIFSINSINTESWMNNNMDPYHKAVRQNQFNNYVYNEVVPFIRNNTSWDTPIITCGASFGALHSANLFFKRPDLINGCLAMSGVYDLTEYTKGYFNDDVYFNSPIHYLPNLNDHNILEQIRRSHHIHILTGSGDHEDPEANRRFGGVLYSKGINYELDIWGHEWKHDWLPGVPCCHITWERDFKKGGRRYKKEFRLKNCVSSITEFLFDPNSFALIELRCPPGCILFDGRRTLVH